MKEVWKDIKGYEDSYQISNKGRFKSKTRTQIFKNGKIYKRKGRLHKLKVYSNNGYIIVGLCKQNKRKNMTIHRLVAQAFIDNSLGKPCINHINGIKTDNRVENLEWVTYKENGIKAVEQGLIKTGKESPNYGNYDLNKKKNKKVEMLSTKNEVLKIFSSISSAARYLGNKEYATDIVKVCKNKRKTAYGYKWRYNEL